MKYPVGSRFITKDLGLVRSYLPNMVEKKESRFITTMDIYKDEPWLLRHVRNPLFYANEWYYFVPRTRKGANGVTPNRIVPGRGGRPGGFWKSTGKILNIIDREHRLMGHKQRLTYHTGVHGNSVKTDWLMTEYTLAKKKDEFQELVLCFIRLKKKTKDENLGFVDVFVPQPQPPLQVVENNRDTNIFASTNQVVQEEAGLIDFADELEMMLEGDIPQQRQEEETPNIPPTQSNNNNNVLMVSSQQEVQEEEADLTGYADNLEMMMLEGDQEPEQQQQQQEEEIRIAPPMHINDDNNIDWDWDIHDADTWAMLDFFLV